MAGDVQMGICYVCRKVVTDEDFSNECYKIYRNVTHTGECYETFKERAEQYEKTKKRTVMERLAELEERMDRIEGVFIRKDTEFTGEDFTPEERDHLREVAKQAQKLGEKLRVDIDRVAMERYFKSKGGLH